MVLTVQNSVSICQKNPEVKDRVEMVSKDTWYNVMFVECCLIYFVYVQSKV